MCGNGELSKCIKIKVKKFALNSLLYISGYDTKIGANDVIVVKQQDGSIKASPVQLYLKITPEMRNTVSLSKSGSVSNIQVCEKKLIECMHIKSSHLEHDEVELSFDITSQHLREINLDYGMNTCYFIIESLNVRIPFSIYVFNPDDKIIISDIDGTITKSDTWGFFGGAMGYKVHHEYVNSFLHNVHENGYKIVYLTARPISYQSFTRNYLFEMITKSNQRFSRSLRGPLRTSEKVLDGPPLPQGPVLCIPKDLAEAALGDSSKAIEGKSSTLQNVLALFEDPSTVVAGAYGNNNSDSEAYKNIGIPPNKTFMINKKSKIVNIMTKEETTYKLQSDNLNNIYPEY